MARTIATRLVLIALCAGLLTGTALAASDQAKGSDAKSPADGAKRDGSDTKPAADAKDAVGSEGKPASAKETGAKKTIPRGNRPDLDKLFEDVAWEGPGTTMEELQGKTVVVLGFVTWCPKCNAWSPEMLKHVKKAIAGKPVVVLAISSDVAPSKAKEYMTQRGFSGRNILYGYDPQMTLNRNGLFNYIIVGPTGNLVSSGQAGAPYPDTDPKLYAMEKELDENPDSGKFRFIDPEMPPALEDALWPLELGHIMQAGSKWKGAAKTLKDPDLKVLKKKYKQFLDDELATLEKMAAGQPKERVVALAKATLLANSFKTSKQGKAAKKLVDELAKDEALKNEIDARKNYDKSMKTPDTDRRVLALQTVAKQFNGTHYGDLAGKAAAAAKQ